jgi:tetratricopeptide (TPR) repeat protein
MLALRILRRARRGEVDHACVGAVTARPGARLLASAMSLLIGLALLAVPPGQGALAADDASMVAVPKAIDIDGLFERLKNAPDAAAAAFTSRAIEQRWARSGSDTADLLMQRANTALAAGDRPLAIELIDRVIFLEPNWAEGWNRRATIFFLDEDLSRSASDIEEVLRLEPRHFGALMGLAGILERIGDDRKALRAYERVLEIYPTLAAAQKGAERLKSRLGDTAI